MKLLLDTHIFIWWVSEPRKLSPQARSLCADSANTLVVSVASIWEMQIKLQLNKLTLYLPLEQLIANQQQTNNVVILPIELTHVLALQALPAHHKDPFDRMLVAQAIAEQVALVSADKALAAYPVQLLG